MSPFGMMPNPSLIAASVTERTTTAEIQLSGAIVPLSNPIRIAEEYAMIDNVTGVRLIAGFVRGIGFEYHSYMVNPSQSLERFHEAHDLILQAWTQPGPPAFEGRFYRFQYVNLWPRPFQEYLIEDLGAVAAVTRIAPVKTADANT